MADVKLTSGLKEGNLIKRLVKYAKKEVIIVSPFIGKSVLEEIVASTYGHVEFKILTNLRKKIPYQPSYYEDDATKYLRELANRSKIEIRTNDDLNAKMYIFDRKEAILTSMNLTKKGFTTNLECSVLFTDEAIVQEKILPEFHNLWNKHSTHPFPEKSNYKARYIIKGPNE